MSRREKEKKASLDALSKLAFSVSGGAPPPPPKPAEKMSSLPAPKAAPRPAAPPRDFTKTQAQVDAERARKAQLESRRAKLEEERALKKRREDELARSNNLAWRGMSMGDVPTSIRRTAFDRVEPTVTQKISDVLGDAKEKEGRAKARDKGRRVGGGR